MQHNQLDRQYATCSHQLNHVPTDNTLSVLTDKALCILTNRALNAYHVCVQALSQKA
jgi:hypothetical protein